LFVVTPHIEEYADTFLEHIYRYDPQADHDNRRLDIGYFGSGKSHLAKMLAQVTANRTLDGLPASQTVQCTRAPFSGKKEIH